MIFTYHHGSSIDDPQHVSIYATAGEQGGDRLRTDGPERLHSKRILSGPFI